MSYILDALRRADSDRERGAVPSLHSNTGAARLADADADADDGDAAASSVRPLWWAVGGLSIALVVMMGWLLFGRSPHPAEPTPVVVAQAPPVNLPAPVVPLARPEPLEASPPAAETPATPPANVQPAKPPRRSAARSQPDAEARPEPRPAKPSPAAPTSDTESPVPSISELPDDVRRQLPALSVSGATYSRNASSRMLILNGQVFREGDKVSNDVVLEQIRLKSAVLSFRGRRYSISF